MTLLPSGLKLDHFLSYISLIHCCSYVNFYLKVKEKISTLINWIYRIRFDWYAGLSLTPRDDNENQQILDDSQVDDLVENCQPSTSQAANERESKMQREAQEKESTQNKDKKKRVKSLDAFRGLSITIMIFVNYGGGGYW